MTETDDEIPMRDDALPAGWTSEVIERLGEVQLGKMLDRAKNQGKPASYLRNINVRWLSFDLDDLKQVRVSAAEMERFSVRDGDVFVCEGGEPGRSAVWRGGGNLLVYQKALLRFRSNGAIMPEWLAHRLRLDAESRALEDYFSGTTIKHFTRKSFLRYRLPIAPLAEQKRIADKLEVLLGRVDACRARLDRLPALLKRFRQSVLAAATSGRLTEEWREDMGTSNERKSSTLATCGTVSGGLTKNAKRKTLPFVKPYLRVANVQANSLDLSDVSEIGLTEREHAKTRLQPGDLLIVEGNGSIDQIGRVSMWNGEIDDCVHQNHLIRWRSTGADARFVLYWLLSPQGRDALMAQASTTTGLHTLSISKVSAIPIELPPLPEQQEIVRRVEALFAFADRIESRLAGARKLVDRLTPATLAKAFRGELVPQDPNDEPASGLLERLAANRPGPAARKRRCKRSKTP